MSPYPLYLIHYPPYPTNLTLYPTHPTSYPTHVPYLTPHPPHPQLLHTVEHIVVYGEQAGRFDHIMANVNTLYKFASSSPPPPSPPHTAAAAADILKRAPPHIYLYAHDSCTFALQVTVYHTLMYIVLVLFGGVLSSHPGT